MNQCHSTKSKYFLFEVTVLSFLPTESEARITVGQSIHRKSARYDWGFRRNRDSSAPMQGKNSGSFQETTAGITGKRQQLWKPVEERPEDLTRDIDEALQDSEEGRVETQWMPPNPEDGYRSEYRAGPDGRGAYEVREPSPEAFVYRDYPETANNTFSDGIENDGMESLPEQNVDDQSEDVLVPFTGTKLRNDEDLDMGAENIPGLAAKELTTTRYEDTTADGAFPLSADEVRGTFKINKGAVTGEGRYELNPDGAKVRLKLHIETPTKGGPTKGGLDGGYGIRRGHFGNKIADKSRSA